LVAAAERSDPTDALNWFGVNERCRHMTAFAPIIFGGGPVRAPPRSPSSPRTPLTSPRHPMSTHQLPLAGRSARAVEQLSGALRRHGERQAPGRNDRRALDASVASEPPSSVWRRDRELWVSRCEVPCSRAGAFWGIWAPTQASHPGPAGDRRDRSQPQPGLQESLLTSPFVGHAMRTIGFIYEWKKGALEWN
jgi:hypothetical protein